MATSYKPPIVVDDTTGLLRDLVSSTEHPSIFGSRYTYAADEGTSSNSTGTFSTKLTLTTPDGPAGDYLIGYQWSWFVSSTTIRPEFRVRLDGTTDLMIFSPNVLATTTVVIPLESGFKQHTLTSAVHTITIEYRIAAGTGSLTIQTARIDYWRVA